MESSTSSFYKGQLQLADILSKQLKKMKKFLFKQEGRIKTNTKRERFLIDKRKYFVLFIN